MGSHGVLHTHSVVTKVDLDVAGLENSFKIKKPMLGNLDDLLDSTGIDKTGISYQSPTSYYFGPEPITSEGTWDWDGDMTWTPPKACIQGKAGEKYVAVSKSKSDLGNYRSFEIDMPAMPPQLLPEHDKFLHLQNFTKCNLAVTKHNEADLYAVPPEVFGALYPNTAFPGHDISHFFTNESLVDVDLVFYVSATKYHYVRTEDVPVPTTMGKYIDFEPLNYFTDDVGTIKHLPKSMYRYNQDIGLSRTIRTDAKPISSCIA